MINIKKAKQVFDEYVESYDMSNPMIKLKYNHTYRVCEQSIAICKSLGLNEEETNLAYLIALLHDIGRFEQEKLYHTFNDSKSTDHGDLGCHILFDEELIRRFVSDDVSDEIIKEAIWNHNKYKLDEGLDDRTLMHSKIIKDADKIDIIYNATCLGEIKLNDDDSEISELVDEDFKNHVLVKHSHKRTKNDSLLTMISFVFDLNFDYSFQYFKNENYINKYFDKLKNKNIFKKYIDIANDYVEGKCKDVRSKIFTSKSRRREI